MARPVKKGLFYFPLDVDFFADNKTKILKARFGADGITLYIYILCEIYRNGYYVVWDDDTEFIAANELNMAVEKVTQIRKFLLGRSLLDSTLFQSDTILTSAGIQKRYQEAVKERAKKNPVKIEKYWILSEEETEAWLEVAHEGSYSRKNPSYSRKNPSYSQNNPLNKIKENKSKENIKREKKERKNDEEQTPTPAAEEEKPVIELVLSDKTQHPVRQKEIDEWQEAYKALDVMAELKRMVIWLNANPGKRKTAAGINRFVVSWLNRSADQAAHPAIANIRAHPPAAEPVQQKKVYENTPDMFAEIKRYARENKITWKT